jgi:hypothetical protein
MCRVQVDGKCLNLRFEMETAVRTPLGGYWSIGDFDALEYATELLVFLVEDPSAMARFQDDGVHHATMTRGAESTR